MWLWHESFFDSDRRTACPSGPLEQACGEPDVAGEADECGPDTVLEMYHYTNGTYLELNGFLEDAIYEFQEAVSIRPADGFYRYTLGVALLKNGQYNEAFKELTEALRLEPDNFEARCALADVHGEIGRNLELEGRIEAAAEEFREAISMDPDYPDYYACLGRVLIENARESAAVAGNLGRETCAEAIRHLRFALRLDPYCLDALLNLGVALTMDGSGRTLDEGIGMLSTVLQADPFNNEARSSLDYARKIKGREINCS